MDKTTRDLEADIFCRYLVGRPADAKTKELYRNALGTIGHNITTPEQKLLKLCLQYRWLVSFIDGGLALISPLSEVRRRIYIMLAILEASPLYASHFLPRKRSPLYVVTAGLVGVRAVVIALLGSLLVKVVR